MWMYVEFCFVCFVGHVCVSIFMSSHDIYEYMHTYIHTYIHAYTTGHQNAQAPARRAQVSGAIQDHACSDALYR